MSGKKQQEPETCIVIYDIYQVI